MWSFKMSRARKKKAFARETTREIVGFDANEFMEASEAWGRQPTREVDGFDPASLMEEAGERSEAKFVKPRIVKSRGVEEDERAFFGAA